jgi:hypothetical protein
VWKQGLPLLRLHGERIYQTDGVFNVISPNMFAGSILDLEPDTGYEARFTMSDPDGFIGQTAKIVTKTVSVRTRPEPKPYAGGRVFHVYPPNYQGTRIEPAFDGLMCAYNYYCGGGDTVTAGRPRVKPGDTILIHAGLYRYRADLYTGDRNINATTPVEGTYYLTASGTADRPIAIFAQDSIPASRSSRTALNTSRFGTLLVWLAWPMSSLRPFTCESRLYTGQVPGAATAIGATEEEGSLVSPSSPDQAKTIRANRVTRGRDCSSGRNPIKRFSDYGVAQAWNKPPMRSFPPWRRQAKQAIQILMQLLPLLVVSRLSLPEFLLNSR